MGPQLLFSAIMSISGAFAVGNVPMALTGFPSTNYSTHTLLLHMQDYAVNRYEMGYSSAIAVVLFIIMVITWYAINRALRRFTAI
jgi:multiple sugar transport system permease protein